MAPYSQTKNKEESLYLPTYAVVMCCPNQELSESFF